MTYIADAAAPAAVVCPLARVKTLIGNYPNTAALKTGQIASDRVTLVFDPAAKPAHAFKRAVQGEFDVAELSIVTYLIAQARGYPLALLPAVMFSRVQHPYVVYDVERGPMRPVDLHGKRVGVAYYTTATSTWLRDVLAADYGVDLTHLTWVVQESPHVPEFKDPANVERAPAGADLVAMLFAGEIDALIMTPVPDHPRLVRLIPDANAAADAWLAHHKHLQLNHMVVTRKELVQERPEIVREVWRLLVAAKHAGSSTPVGSAMDMVPYGLAALRPHLDAAIDCVHRQGLIRRRPMVEELFDDVTRALTA
jgi:4,5-dihydroxyphthalate decarboxylase